MMQTMMQAPFSHSLKTIWHSMKNLTLALSILALCACSSLPELKYPDGSVRIPVNGKAANNKTAPAKAAATGLEGKESGFKTVAPADTLASRTPQGPLKLQLARKVARKTAPASTGPASPIPVLPVAQRTGTAKTA